MTVKKPLSALGVLEVGASVVVDFKDLTLSGLDPVVITVAALPPLSATQRTAAKAIVVPGFEYLRDYILPVTQAEGGGKFNLTAYGNLNLSTEELWHFDSSPYVIAS